MQCARARCTYTWHGMLRNLGKLAAPCWVPVVYRQKNLRRCRAMLHRGRIRCSCSLKNDLLRYLPGLSDPIPALSSGPCAGPISQKRAPPSVHTSNPHELITVTGPPPNEHVPSVNYRRRIFCGEYAGRQSRLPRFVVSCRIGATERAYLPCGNLWVLRFVATSAEGFS